MTCRLLPGLLGILLQGLLFASACSVLLAKKLWELPWRPWPVFLADSSKQILAAGWVHVLNLGCAWALKEVGGDACDWYAVNIVVDCTLGVFLEYVLLLAWTRCLRGSVSATCSSELESGCYYTQVGYNGEVYFDAAKFWKQVGLWLVVVTQMKLLVVGFMYLASPWLLSIAEVTLGRMQNDAEKLFVVMILIPLLMNAFQFCVVDAFLKSERRQGPECQHCDRHPRSNFGCS